MSKTLARRDLTENTLVVCCSDNGPGLDDGYKDDAIEKIGSHRAGGPFTGGKYSVYEGGTRTPFITHWKGRIAPGVSEQVVCTIDLAGSLASLTEQSIPSDACLDSMDVMEALLGQKNAKGRDHLVQQDNGSNGTYALRRGPWKLHRYGKKRTARNVVVEQQLANTKVPEYQLFNLDDDPSEKTNVIQDHPDVAKQLREELEQIIQSGRTRT